jgi:phenylacetate-CoA ligase
MSTPRIRRLRYTALTDVNGCGYPRRGVRLYGVARGWGVRPVAGLLRFKLRKTPDEIDSVLTHLVRDVGRWVPFYRDLFRNAGIDVARFRGARDLATLPRSSKDAFRESPERDCLREGRDPRRCARTSTSGSTGAPLTVYLSHPELYFRRYSVLTGLRHYTPLRLPVRVADVGSMVPHGGRSAEQSLGIVHLLRIPGNMPLARQRAALLRHRPTVLQGYPTCLELLAESLSESEARQVRPLLVACRGERLRQSTRDLLQQTFRAHVASLYNCEEVGNLAWECPEHTDRFHMNRDTCVLEVLDSQGSTADGQGDVLVTNLYNHTMPFLRYRLDDRARLVGPAEGTCSCGAAGPWLEDLSGSEDDFVLFPDGRRMSPLLLSNALFDGFRVPSDPHRLSPSVRRYQIIQEEDYSLRVILDWRGPFDAVVWRQIASEMNRASQGLRCTVESSAAFELTAAGKFKEVLSRAPVGAARRLQLDEPR